MRAQLEREQPSRAQLGLWTESETFMERQQKSDAFIKKKNILRKKPIQNFKSSSHSTRTDKLFWTKLRDRRFSVCMLETHMPVHFVGL